MPKELSHILFADAVAARLIAATAPPPLGPQSYAGSSDRLADGRFEDAPWLAGLIVGARPSYHYGAAAPDTAYYAAPTFGRFWGRVRGRRSRIAAAPLGEIVHGDRGEDTAAAIVEMLRRLRSIDPRAPAFAHGAAFAAGYLTHMALDMTLHPWIFAVTGPSQDPDASRRRIALAGHRALEARLDLYLAARDGAMLRQGDPAANLAGAFAALDAMVDPGPSIRRMNLESLTLWGRCLQHVFGVERDLAPALKRGFRLHRLCLRLYRTSWIGVALRRLDRVAFGRLTPVAALFYPVAGSGAGAGPSFAAFSHSGFVHPVTGLHQDDGLEALWRSALDRAHRFLVAADRYLAHGADIAELTRAIDGYSLSMGLPHCPTASAEHFRPIPLSELMDPQQ
jgi:hypothetical protein